MILIGIAGGSGSGKTTFAKKVCALAGSQDVILLSQDSYYLSAPNPALKVHGIDNFDHPEAFDWPLLRDHLTQFKNGKSVHVPTYDYISTRRTPETVLMGPAKVILLEGIFSLWDKEIRKLFDLKVFLQVDADIRFIRLLHRDIKERGRTSDGVVKRYYDTVRPMYHQFIESTQQYADLIVSEETDQAAEVLAAYVREKAAT